jgi:hypothetical protein
MIRRIAFCLTLTTAVLSSPALAQPPAIQGQEPADALLMRSLQSSVSAVFDPGTKTARIKLIETDAHGVEGLRTLKTGDLYRDGWRLNAVTATEATLRKGKSILHVNFSRGWTTRPALIQPAVLVQPIPPAGPSNSLRGLSALAGRRGQPAGLAGRAAAPGMGLSNARVGGSPPPPPGPPIVSTFQGPAGPLSIQLNPDGSRTVTSSVNGRNIVLNVPAGQ